MLERLIEIDHSVFLYLNTLGSSSFDSLWLMITKFYYWIPIFAWILYLTVKKLGWKHTLLIMFCLALLITITDQSTNLVKHLVQRLRPCNNPEFEGIMRQVQVRQSFSFFSGHASSSMAVTFFIFKVLRPHLKYIGFFFIWPLLFAYSRIYLGLHYPGDILCGYIFGIITATLMYFLYLKLRKLYIEPKSENL